jgi:hypothetical protein
MPSQDRTDAASLVAKNYTHGLKAECTDVPVGLALTPTEEFIASGKLLLAYLFEGAIVPSEDKWLPEELRRVLQLPQTPRQCFVLRILAGWSRDQAAAALGLSPEIVDCELGQAAMGMALMAEKQHGL